MYNVIMNDKIIIRGANQHNLKNVSLELPKNELIVFTGVSGSGKSSLAFDTIFAEGQRRYIESLSVYARQFLGQLDKPDVESIEGLSPAIAIDQKSTSNNPRSTVGTVTEIYDFLRLLFASIGIPHCPNCGREVVPQTVDEIVDRILNMPKGAKIQLLAPVVRSKKGEYSALLSSIRSEGFARVRIDGNIFNLADDEIKINKNQKHDIEIVIDRLIVKEGINARLTDSVQLGLQKGDGLLYVENDGKITMFSEKASCPECNLSFDEITPRIFSFNAPYGACPTCSGLGAHFKINPDLIVPDDTKSLSGGAIYPWMKTGNPYYQEVINSVAREFNINTEIPFRELSEEHKNIILYGSNGQRVHMEYMNFSGTHLEKKYIAFSGVIPYLEKKYNETASEETRDDVQKYMSAIPCNDCHGARLKPFPLAITVGGKNIYEICKMSVKDAFAFFSTLSLELTDYQYTISKQIITEITSRLKFMLDVGLGYLDCARTAGTLSGGEAQRIRLATQIGSGLSGVLYVLDEPSIGLHQYNNDMLIKTLLKLRNLGNTLIVVEHDEETIRSADYIVDIGVNAGEHGGNVVCQGSVEDIKQCRNSLTGDYLSGRQKIAVPETRREGNGQFLHIIGASKNNLKNINVDIPLGKINVITGLSGSGKSSLMNDLIYEYAIHKLRGNRPKPQGIERIDGFENIDKVINIDQSPIGRTPRSNPATYTDVFTHIRDLFTKTGEARMRGYKAGRFSFNVKGGRCEACKGDGVKKIEMSFLSDVYVTCDVCNGKRYNRETLEVKYKGKDISDVLNMSVSEAYEFFENIPKIQNRLKTLKDVGLGYIRLGQSADTLSGGEAQRIKLAAELNKKATGKTLYLLDEPSVGLHWADLDKLINIIQKLANAGNTILIIEHNLDIIKIADYITDLGPEGGENGGYVVAQGTPEEVAQCENSYTGQYLAEILKKG
ncbi:MAG: excinuclease ABC subunit UvrA [Candidatus Gastranaerophilales bacterium]|nr:excinuclease ABC subunit UvrA [Candidatus Gastranaerophilales bacterium]